jgi:hypothetical protein
MFNHIESNSEHTFVPGDDAMTAVFASRDKARKAMSALSDAGIPSDEVELVSGADQQAPDTESPGFKQDTPGLEAFDEILHALTETFSDDDKVFVEFDRVLAVGGALLNVRMAGRRPRRSEVASLLKSHGACASYYWGSLATERL